MASLPSIEHPFSFDCSHGERIHPSPEWVPVALATGAIALAYLGTYAFTHLPGHWSLRLVATIALTLPPVYTLLWQADAVHRRSSIATRVLFVPPSGA